MTRTLLLALTLCFVAGVGGAPALELDVPRTEDNPRVEDHALALFTEDAYNRALVCPGQRTTSQPADPTRMRCAFSPVATLGLRAPIRAGLTGTRYEHDGMYGFTEDVVLVSRAPSGVDEIIATLTQLEVDVDDGRSRLRMRRQRVVDAPDGPLLCVESVVECGPGLFTVIELEGRPWRPTARSRGVDAFVLNASRRLERAAALDGLCPSRGYEAFVAPESESAEPVSRRRGVQGDARVRGGACF